ncbi:MAG: MFS transporter [Nocardioides alkalitolerans]
MTLADARPDPVSSRPPGSPWARPYGAVTAGAFGLSFLFAFEALAVATVMPAVARELDGLALYPVAFAAPLAAAVVALVVAGPLADRHGPSPVLHGGLVVFATGVVLAGVAWSMPVFLLGRLVHGAGGGVIGVALYVVVAEAYPAALRPRVFAVLTAAWVLPAVVGPGIAALVADTVGWRWVFLAVPVLAVGALALVRQADLARPRREEAPGPEPRRVLLALGAALGVVAASVGGQRGVVGWPLLVLAGLALSVATGARLLPRGAWTGGRGLPAVLGTRAVVGVTFHLAEVYLPLLLTLGRGLSLVAAGAVLTTGAVTWCLGAVLASRWRRLADEEQRVRLGAALVALGAGGAVLAGTSAVPLAVPVVGWAVAGLGIGMAYSTLSVLALACATDGEAGATSSALQLNDHLVISAVLALGGVAFAGFASGAPVLGATLLVAAAAAVGMLAQVPARRLRAPGATA